MSIDLCEAELDRSAGLSSLVLRILYASRLGRARCQQCLPDRRKPDVLRPGIVGMRGVDVIRLRPCMA